jgi:predicted dehydrogenase
VRSVRYDAPPPHLIKEDVWGKWDLAGGGMLMTKAIHQIDLLLWLFGKVKCVHAMMKTSLLPIESEDQVIANIEFENGVSAQPHSGYVETLDCVGVNGIAAHPWELKLTDKAAEKLTTDELTIKFPLPKKVTRINAIIEKLCGIDPMESPHTAFLRRFIEAATHTDISVPVQAQEGREALEVCTALYASALTGRSISLPLDSSSPFYKSISSKDYSNKK